MKAVPAHETESEHTGVESDEQGAFTSTRFWRAAISAKTRVALFSAERSC
jgi:hypothetical protein